MSATLALQEVRLENSPQASAQNEEDLKSGVPSIASLRKFASKLHRGLRHRRDRNVKSSVTSASHGGTANSVRESDSPRSAIAELEAVREPQGAQQQIGIQSESLLGRPGESPGMNDAGGQDLLPSAIAELPSPTPISRHVVQTEETVEEAETEPACTSRPLSISEPTPPEAETKPVSTSKPLSISEPTPPEAESGIPQVPEASGAQEHDIKPNVVIDTGADKEDVEAGRNDNEQSGPSNAIVPSSSTSQDVSQMIVAPSTSAPSISAKGKETVHGNNTKPLSVHVPGGRFERLLPVRIATPDVKAERVLAKHSEADLERLRKFSGVLRSAKDRMELFGREMPLIRIFLVQVTEGNSSPNNYICVQGLCTQSDITTFHAAMSQKRYRPCYQPLKLCYDTSKLNKVGLHEPHVAASSTVATSANQLYSPTCNDETYCGALFQILVEAKPWISTLGGVIEIGDRMYVMACLHSSLRSDDATTDADTLRGDEDNGGTSLESDTRENTEKPLVFANDDFLQEVDEQPVTKSKDALSFIDRQWKQLNLDGEVAVGSEWCLLPIWSDSLLPNFVDESIDNFKASHRNKRHYIDQVCEPRGGSSALIATGTDSRPSGAVLNNSSFIAAGGSNELLEVLTVILDDGQRNIQKGDSGSWVIDTSDPIHFKLIGSVIAASEGEAYFIPTNDQFHEMVRSVDHGKSARLVSAFRALVNCANLAFLVGDAKSDYWIDEALSPQAMEQFHSGWYMAALKRFLGDGGDTQQRGKSSQAHPDSTRRSVMKELLLLHGCELLDSLLDIRGFERRCDSELTDAHRRTLRELEDILRQSKSDELSRLERIASARSGSYAFVHQRTRRPPSRIRLNSPNAPIVARRRQPQMNTRFRILGHEIYIKTGSTPREILVVISAVIILAEGVASAVGTAAAAATFSVQSKDSHQPTSITIAQYIGLGAVIGPISAAVMILQILLIFFSQTYQWSLSCGSISLSVSSRGWLRMLFFVTMIMVSAVARIMLPTLYVAKQREIQVDRNLLTAAAVAAIPSFFSAASPSIFWSLGNSPEFAWLLFYIYRRGGWFRRYIRSENIAYAPLYFTCVSIMVGFEALAGYTFVKMYQNSGHDTPDPSTGAAGAGILGALIMVLVSLPLTRFLRHLYGKTVLPRMSGGV